MHDKVNAVCDLLFHTNVLFVAGLQALPPPFIGLSEMV